MKRAFRILAWTAAAIIAFVLVLIIAAAGFAYWAFNNPLEAFHIAEKHVLPPDLKIDWRNIDFDGKRLDGLDFEMDVTVLNLHIVKASPNLDLPIDKIRLRASVFPMRRIATIHELAAAATSPLIFAADSNAPPSPEKNPFQQIQSVLKILDLIHDYTPIEQLSASVDKFVLKTATGTEIAMSLQLSQPVQQPMNLKFKMSMPGTTKFESGADAKLDFSKMRTSDAFLTGILKFKGSGVETVLDVAISSDAEKATVKTSGPIQYRKDRMTLAFDPKLNAEFTASEAKIHVVSPVKGIPGPLVQIDDVRLDLATPLEQGESWSEEPSTFSLSAPIALFFVKADQRKLLESSCSCQLPKTLLATAQGKVWLLPLLTKPIPNALARDLLDIDFKIESVKNKVFSANIAGKLQLKTEADPSGVSHYQFAPYLNSNLKIHRFLLIRPLLDSYGILIPAPLDVLDGVIELATNGPVATTAHGSQFPAELTVDLYGKGQTVKGGATASVEINQRFTEAHLDVDAKIATLNLDLPPLKPLDGLPRISIDSRFMKEPPKKTKPPKFKFSFNFNVATTTPDSIRLKSEFFGPYLPLSLKIQAANGGDNTGFVNIQPFDITYLRRTVHVESLVVNLNGDEDGEFPIKGRFRVKQTDYTVFIDVEGNTKSPTIVMSSEPYLSKDEIISVLLYDRTSKQLVSGDVETVGGVQAAIADKAIGLFGLWAFAATPIKSFSYNPVTKVYTATVAVSDDVTAGIGSSWESATRLELRKRVSKRWSLTAAWTPATQDESGVTKLVLQWEKRF